jgi:hypothetical protein
VTTTEHEVAVFQEENGWNFILVWIDNEDIETFSEEYTLDEWQTARLRAVAKPTGGHRVRGRER